MGIIVLSLCLLCLGVHSKAASLSPTSRYACITDVGSSGSRVRVYTWNDVKSNVPSDVTEIGSFKQYPGFSTYATLSDDAIETYVRSLLDYAIANVPESAHSKTPFFFLATAGLRLLDAADGHRLMETANSILQEQNINPFKYDPQNCRVTAGEEEAAFAWAATNYLKGFFSNESNNSVGIVEMGGASAQIAFLPETDTLSGLYPVHFGDKTYNIYTHSFLEYGQEGATRWINTHLWQEAGNPIQFDNPCFLKGESRIVEIDGTSVHMRGSGRADACMQAVQRLVYTVPDGYCHPRPCSIGPFYQPDIPAEMVFHGLSTLMFTLLDIQQWYNPPNVNNQVDSLRDLKASTIRFCKENVKKAVQLSNQPALYAKDMCLLGLYATTLLEKGLHLGDNQILLEGKIQGRDIEWSLGAALLLAASD